MKVLATAVDWGDFDRLPKLPRVKVAERDYDWLRPEEHRAAVAAARTEEEGLAILFAVATGNSWPWSSPICTSSGTTWWCGATGRPQGS
jgi:hypothetical protein